MNSEFLLFCGGLMAAALAFIAWTAGRDILRLRRIAREACKPDPTPFPIRAGWYCEYARGAGEEV